MDASNIKPATDDVLELASAALQSRALRASADDCELVLRFPDFESRQRFVLALEDLRQTTLRA